MTILLVTLILIALIYAIISIRESIRIKRENEDNKIRAWARQARADDIAKGHYRNW